MNKDQVKKIKELNLKDDGTGKPVAGVLSIVFNDEICFRNTDDFVIYDDANELVHVIKINMDGPQSSAAWPYKIATGYYGNIQFMEGLYNMGNFAKIVDELLYNPGLIDDKQKSMIMEWAKNIRNHSLTPKAPGPYYKDTTKIPPHPPVPEVRDDGLFHASPIAMRTAQNKLLQVITPVFDGTDFTKVKPCVYKYTNHDMSEIPAIIKSAIEAVGNDLFYASFSDNKYAATYNPKDEKSVSNFEMNAERILPKLNEIKKLVFYVEANGVRVDYEFTFTCEYSDEDRQEWVRKTEEALNDFVDNINPDVARVSRRGNEFTVDILVEDPDIGFTDFLYNLEDMSVTRLRNESGSYMMTPNNQSSYEEFKKGVKRTIPTVTGEVNSAEVTIMGNTNGSIVYTLKVKYYNDADCECRIGGVYYNTLAEAVAAAADGAEIDVQKNIAVAAETMYQIDNGREITINLNDHEVVFADNKSYFFVRDGKLNIANGKLTNPTTYAAKVVALPEDNEHKSIFNGDNLEIEGLYGVIVSFQNKTTDRYGAKIVLKDSNIQINGDGIGVTINGNINSLTGSVPEIDLNNVTITANDDEAVAVYGAGYGTWNIVDCTFEGTDAISLKSGEINVNGGTYTGTGPYKDPADGNNNGTENTGAALALTNNDGYAKKLDVVVESGTFSSVNGHAIYEGIAKKNGTPVCAAAYTTISILDGTYDAGNDKAAVNITTAANKEVIRGGSYNTDVSAFLADGFKIVEESGRFVVEPESAEEEIDEVIDNVQREGLTIEQDPSLENTYNIVTDNGKIADSGLFDQLDALSNLVSIVVSDGTNELTYLKGSTNLETFKAAVDDMVPQHNLDEEVVLTMTIELDNVD